METIEQTAIEPGLERDLSGLDAIPSPEAMETLPGQGDPSTDEDEGESSKRSARGIIKALEWFFRLKLPGFYYTDDKYDEAEKELAPLLEKYELSQAGPLKYSAEFQAAGFLGGTIFESVKAVKEAREEQEEIEEKTKKPITLGVESGEPSKPFTTQ